MSNWFLKKSLPAGRQAQSTFEYAILVTVVVGAIIAMSTYMRRAAQGRLKNIEIDLNQERNK